MRSVGEAARALQERAQARAAEARARNPQIARREAEIADVRAFAPNLLCPVCHGYGLRCSHCDGFGFVCPDCRGMRWVKRTVPETGRQTVIRCQTCTHPDGTHNAEAEQLAIGRVFERLAQARRRQARMDGEEFDP